MKLACLSLLLCCVGCMTETRTYSLAVRNTLDRPVSVCLTKLNSPSEPEWESPEELIQPPHPANDQKTPGVVIPPGKLLTRDNFSGLFDKQRGRAFLRIYAGTPNLTEMNAISPRSANRFDVPLDAGLNCFIIQYTNGGLMEAVPVPPTDPQLHPHHP